MIYLTGTIAVETRIVLKIFYGKAILDVWAGYDMDGKQEIRNSFLMF